jgi:hypothetical protein
MRFTTQIIIFGLAVICLPGIGFAQKKKGKNPHSFFDLEYAKGDGISLKLDLHMPSKKTDKKPELVVFFHGGSWRGGSKKTSQVSWLTHHGYAVASVDYRLSGLAKFPALVHDCKGAIRWLRANADKYGINAKRICASGASAGGLLSTLVGTSGGIKALEGTVGGNLDQSSRVQSALGMFCPTDLYYNATVEKGGCDQPNCPLYQFAWRQAEQTTRDGQTGQCHGSHHERRPTRHRALRHGRKITRQAAPRGTSKGPLR